MAKRGRVRTVYRRAKKGYRKRKGLLSGNLGNIAWGAAAGVASPLIPRILGKWTLPAVFGAAGYFFHKPALLGIAGYELGKSISLGGVTSGGGQTIWEG